MWILADTIFGIILLIVGIIFRARPPRHINDLVGYRTRRSTRNQDTWDEANGYSARQLILVSFAAIAIGVACGLLLQVSGVFIVEGSALAMVFWMIYRTEKHLKTLFDEDGQRRDADGK